MTILSYERNVLNKKIILYIEYVDNGTIIKMNDKEYKFETNDEIYNLLNDLIVSGYKIPNFSLNINRNYFLSYEILEQGFSIEKKYIKDINNIFDVSENERNKIIEKEFKNIEEIIKEKSVK